MAIQKTQAQFLEALMQARGDEITCLGEYQGAITKILFRDNVINKTWLCKPSNALSGRSHPNRLRKTQAQFLEDLMQARGDEVTCLGEYKGVQTKTLFRDNIINKEWECTPNEVLSGASHPDRPRKTHEEFIADLKERRGDEITCLGEYQGVRTKILFRDNHIDKTWLCTPHSVLNRGSSHPDRPRPSPRKTHGDFLADLKEKRGDEITCLDEYQGTYTKILFRDNVIDKTWSSTPHSVLNGGSSHPDRPRKTHEEFLVKLKEKRGDEITCLGEYQVTYTKILFRDNVINKTWLCKPSNVLSGNSHPDRPASSQYTIKHTSKPVYLWFAENYPEIPKGTIRGLLNRKNLHDKEVEAEDLEDMCKAWQSSSTSLEHDLGNIMNLDFYNKKTVRYIKEDGTEGHYRADFKLSDTVYAEADGLYWHSDTMKSKKYHFNKREHYEAEGKRVLQFRSDEIRQKPEIVKSIVDNNLGNSRRIFARKCQISEPTYKESVQFLEDNHLMGPTKARRLGLYFEGCLVCIILFKEVKSKRVCKVERFCHLRGITVVGGFSKLLRAMELQLREDTEEIHNWVDLRYGTGDHLLDKGFEIRKTTLGWRWTDCTNTFNRLSCKANMDSRGLTELQHASELGLIRIHDAGQRCFVKKLKRC